MARSFNFFHLYAGVGAQSNRTMDHETRLGECFFLRQIDIFFLSRLSKFYSCYRFSLISSNFSRSNVNYFRVSVPANIINR